VVFALLLEISARVVGYFANNCQVYYLFYGWKSWTNDAGEGHSEKFDGYYKFPPNKTLTAYGHTPTPVRINNHGFRGADFDAERTPGVKRVIAIGESSTFGYEDPDDGTYPYLLEVALNRGSEGERKVEVLNCGIPHVNSENIAALLEHEVLDYRPDVLTLMCGYNDAMYPLAETAGAKLSRLLDEYSAAYAGMRKLVNKVGGSLENKWTSYAESMPAAKVAVQLALHEEMTRKNLRRILELAREHHVPIVLIRQTMTGYFEAERLGHPMEQRPTYAEETAQVADKLATKGALHGFEARVHIHRKLMAIVEELAAEYGVPLVDNTKLVDEDVAKYLVTSVHLSPDANARLANELEKVVRPMLR
jgi:lysophospholipase L1-like esterase